MLDLHTHILPGMDDGSRSAEQSIAMLQMEAEQGVDTVVMTPHYDADRESPAEFAVRRAAAEYQLRTALANQRGMPALLSGAEVAYFEGLSRVADLTPLCIGHTGAMLVEMPFGPWNRRMLGELFELKQVRGIQPILAHVERYRAFQPAGTLEELNHSGVWLQCNASFFLRWQTSRQAMGMLRQQLIHFIASDCHNLDRRPPNVGAAIQRVEKKLGTEAVAFLWQNKDALLGGMT